VKLKTKMSCKISILLPAYKSDYLFSKVFLPSFLKNCSQKTELIIYDNGGNAGALLPWKVKACGTSKALGKNEIKVIGEGKNSGLNVALNECAKVATGDYFYLPHSDMYLMPGWDTALLDACKNLPPASFLLCSRSIEPTKGHTDFHIIKDYGKEWNEFDEQRLLETYERNKYGSDHTVMSGYRMPFFMHRKLWDLMQGVDDRYFSYCTDDDLVQTAYDKGVRRFWMVYSSLVYHLQGKSNSQQTIDKDSNVPYEYFINKWKSKYPDICHPGQYHPKLIPQYVKVR